MTCLNPAPQPILAPLSPLEYLKRAQEDARKAAATAPPVSPAVETGSAPGPKGGYRRVSLFEGGTPSSPILPVGGTVATLPATPSAPSIPQHPARRRAASRTDTYGATSHTNT